MARRVIDASQLRRVRREIEAAGDRYDRVLRAAIYEAGWAIADASAEIVPVLWGTLKASLDVSRPTKSDPVCRITYGGPAVAYAAYQHEGVRRDGSHVVTQYSEPGKQKHFLKEPLEAETANWPQGLIDRMRGGRRSS